MDGSHSGDDAVGVGAVPLHPEIGRAVAGELVHLGETALVEQAQDAFPGGHLALGPLLVDGCGRGGVDGLVDPASQIGDLAGSRVDVDLHDTEPTQIVEFWADQSSSGKGCGSPSGGAREPGHGIVPADGPER